MNAIKLFLATITLILLVACGGGGSSSDTTGEGTSGEDTTGGGADGSGSNPDPTPDPNDFTGNYNGSQNLVLSLGGISETTDIDANITVTGNSILIDPLSANGSVANNMFVATTNRVSTQNGLTCQFLLTYRGDITRESLSGNITGTAICNQSGTDQTLDVVGTVTATR